MAKTSKKTDAKKEPAKTPAAVPNKKNAAPPQSKSNASKFSPTKDADMDVKALGAEDGLMKLFEDSIKDLYWAENQLVLALPKMAKAASLEELADAILEHHAQTKVQVQRLDNVFEMLGKKRQAKKCDAMEGLLKEGESIVEDTDAGTPARNLGIIMASQKVEHYEIASYTGLVKLADKLGLTDVSALLSKTLDEEHAADDILAGIADNSIDIGDEEE